MSWPNVNVVDVVAKAREFVGTPWHHDARAKGVGIDCSGLVAEVYRELGVPVEDVRGYSQGDEFRALIDVLATHCEAVDFDDVSELWPGDILVFRARRMFNHCGFLSIDGPAPTLIHSYSSPTVMKVVEHPLDRSWWVRIAGVYRYQGATWQR